MDIETLPWDSNFFSIKIGKLYCSNEVFNSQYFCEILEYAKKDKYRLVYVFGNQDFIIPSKVLNDFGGLLVDTKVVFRTNCDVNMYDFTDVSIYDSLFVEDSLIHLAYLSGEYSRYLLDPNFGNNDFKRLYKTWIENSVNNQIADDVFIVKSGSSIVGMATLKLKKDYADIGLIAVDKIAQGKGLGRQLISAIKNYLKERNINSLEVATQLNNNSACTFYEKCGFSVKSISNIYHFWL